MPVFGKRSSSIIFAILILAQLMWFANSEYVVADSAPGDGTGTAADPYIIDSIWDLQNMTDDPGSHYALGSDIDASISKTWNSGAGFIPVGNYSVRFNGSLDGRNYTINGLFIDRPTENNIGLVGYMARNGVIRNLIMTDVNITGYDQTSGFIGTMGSGYLNNSHGQGAVRGHGYLGGLAGKVYGKINDCSFSGNVIGSHDQIGGLVSRIQSGALDNCEFNGNVTGGNYTGGLAAFNFLDGFITNSSSSGTVSGRGYTGGLVGQNAYGSVNNSVSKADVLASYDYSGGLVSENFWGEVVNSRSEGDVVGRNFTGGVFGHNNRGEIWNCSASGDVWGINDVGGFIGRNYDQKISNCSATGDVNGSGKRIGGFMGMNFNKGYVEDCYSTGNISGNANEVGGFAGINDYYSTTIRCYSTGKVVGDGDYYGGFAGYNDRAYIIECHTSSPVNGSCDYVGGLVGKNYYYASISNSYATGNLTGTGWTNGGLVGDNTISSTIRYCYSTGIVNRTGGYSGGLVGYSSGAYAVRYCYWDNITSNLQTSRGGIGKNTTEMMTESTYSGWNFSGIWSMVNHEDYPILSWQNGGYPIAIAGPDITIDEGDSVYFNGSLSHGDHGPLNYSWKIDGELLYGVNRSYTFDDPGIFNVNLIVRNGLGNRDGDALKVYVNDITPPQADAGSNRTVNEDTKVILNGTGSKDNLAIIKWSWTFLYDGSTTEILGEQPEFTFHIPGVYLINLNVSDAAGHWDNDNTTITVLDRTAPISVAGSDRDVNEDTRITLDGSSSTDNVGIVNWTWSFISNGSTVVLYGEKSSYVFDDPGIYEISLNVSDAAGNHQTSSFELTVLDVTSPIISVAQDITVDEGSMVAFDGTSCSDNVGVVNWTWYFIYDDGLVRLYGEVQQYLFENPGIYYVTLKIMDSARNYDEKTLIITVLDITSPIAVAGPDRVIDEDTMVTFDGGSSTDNVGVVNWTWRFVYEGGTFSLYGMTLDHVFENPGSYIVSLVVRDADGNLGEDSFNLEVLDITPPVAIAGPDLNSDEGEILELDGSDSYDNVGIVEYSWTIQDGSPVVLSGTNVEHIFSDPGSYDVILNVSDLAGFWHCDHLTVVVNDITPPEAVCGPDRTVDEGEWVIFNGSNSSDNVGIVDYSWTFDDPDPVILHGKDVGYVFDDPGLFMISLVVSDDSGNIDESSFTLEVLDITDPVINLGEVFIEGDNLGVFNGSGCTDNVGIVNWTWSFISGPDMIKLYGKEVVHIFYSPGTYTVTLEVVDGAGNMASSTFEIEIVDVTPPFLLLEPISVDEDSVLELTCNECTDNFRIENWTWEFMDGDLRIILYGPSPHYRFGDPGVFDVSVKVSDISGNTATGDLVITVNDITKPSVEAGIDQKVKEGNEILFEGSGSDNVGITNWTWEFDDGDGPVTLFGPSVTYIFPNAGMFDVTLEVRDDSGNIRSDTLVVTVEAEDDDSVIPIYVVILILVFLLSGIGVAIFMMMRFKEKKEEKIIADEKKPEDQVPVNNEVLSNFKDSGTKGDEENGNNTGSNMS